METLLPGHRVDAAATATPSTPSAHYRHRPRPDHLGRRRDRAARRGGRPAEGAGREPRRWPGSPPTPSSTRGTCSTPTASTAAKNQVRWQFGVLGPPGAAAAGLGEEPDLAVECLLRPDGDAAATVDRAPALPAAAAAPGRAGRRRGGFDASPELRAGAAVLDDLGRGGRGRARARHASRLAELRRGVAAGRARSTAATDVEDVPGGRLVRRREPLRARVELRAERRRPGAPAADRGPQRPPARPRTGTPPLRYVPDRHAPAPRRPTGARFVSVIDPPDDARGGGRPLPAAPLLAGARRRRRTGRADLGRRAGRADHPVRPPGGRRRRAPSRCSTRPRSTRS